MGIGERCAVQPEQRQVQHTYHKPSDRENLAVTERHPWSHAISPVEELGCEWSCKHAPSLPVIRVTKGHRHRSSRKRGG